MPFIQEPSIFFEILEGPQEDDAHILIYTIDYVQIPFSSSENHIAIDVFFKLVQFGEVQIGAIKNGLYDGIHFFFVFQISSKMPRNHNASYGRSECLEVTVTVNTEVLSLATRIFYFHFEAHLLRRL